MSSSLLLQQCVGCLVRLILIVFCDGWLVTVQLLVCGVLSPGLVQYCSQHSCVVAVKLFLHNNYYKKIVAVFAHKNFKDTHLIFFLLFTEYHLIKKCF